MMLLAILSQALGLLGMTMGPRGGDDITCKFEEWAEGDKDVA